jgi:hypothetical protein
MTPRHGGRRIEGARTPQEIGRDIAEAAQHAAGTLKTHRYVKPWGPQSRAGECCVCARQPDALVHRVAEPTPPSGRRAAPRGSLASRGRSRDVLP